MPSKARADPEHVAALLRNDAVERVEIEAAIDACEIGTAARIAHPPHRIGKRGRMCFELRFERVDAHHEHPRIPQELPRAHHLAGARRRWLFDEAVDLEARANGTANFLVTVARFGACRSYANDDEI